MITTSAARTTSSVSGFGNASLMSTPSSAITSTTAGLISSPGALPAERTWTRPSERSVTSPAAIWLRPALWTQTNSTSGCSFTILPSAWASASSRSRAKRCASTGTKTLIFASPSMSSDSRDVTLDRLLREHPAELVDESLGGLPDVMLGDGVECLAHRAPS